METFYSKQNDETKFTMLILKETVIYMYFTDTC